MSNIHPFLSNGKQSDQSIWEVASSAVGDSGIYKVGTRAVLDDGRVFYYSKSSGAAIVAGKLLTAELQTAAFTELAVPTSLKGVSTVSVTLGATAVTINEYAGGYMIVVDDTGEGITYQIKSHPLAAGAAACVLTLEDPINVDFGANTTVQMIKHPWCDVIIAPAAAAHMAVGVPNTAVIAGTTNPQYFWVQTWGICGVWQDEAPTIGQGLGSGPDTAGQVGILNAAPEIQLGVSMWTGVVGEYSSVFLTIAP